MYLVLKAEHDMKFVGAVNRYQRAGARVICLVVCMGLPILAGQPPPKVLMHFRASDSSPNIGNNMTALGDINHDGKDDIAVGSDPPSQTLIFLGGNPPDSLPTLTLRGQVRPTSVLDMDGDGIPDLVTSAPPNPGLLLYKGVVGGLTTTPVDSLLDPNGVMFGFGFAVAFVDSDNIGDVLVFDHDYPPGGRAQLYLDPFRPGSSREPSWVWLDTSYYQQIVTEGFIDFNGDGAIDIYLDDLPSVGHEGGVVIFLGPNFGQQPDIMIPRPSGFDLPSYEFPRLVRNVGDCNGDGVDDLGVLYGSQPLIYFGGGLNHDFPSLVLAGSGYALSNGGDLNDDGYSDILTGNGRVPDGVVDVYFGGEQLDSAWDYSIYPGDLPPINLEQIGESVSRAGDFDGDGHDDIYFSSDRTVFGQPKDIFVIAGGRGIITEVSGHTEHGAPTSFTLHTPYPNPFNPSTTISFDLPKRGSVKLVVYDVLGREVRRLADQEMTAGTHSVTWDGTDQSGHSAASGVYFFRMTAGGVEKSVKGMLLK
jgi:hypothetical protein